MTGSVYLPIDVLTGGTQPDFDLAADYLELSALFSTTGEALSQDITDALEIGADTDYEDVEAEVQDREEIAFGAVARIGNRARALGDAYPFAIDDSGAVLALRAEPFNLGQVAYLSWPPFPWTSICRRTPEDGCFRDAEKRDARAG